VKFLNYSIINNVYDNAGLPTPMRDPNIPITQKPPYAAFGQINPDGTFAVSGFNEMGQLKELNLVYRTQFLGHYLSAFCPLFPFAKS